MRVGDAAPRGWEAGRCFAFDEACEHEVRFDAGSGEDGGGGEDDDRIVLLVDIASPLLESLDEYLGALAEPTPVERAHHERTFAALRIEYAAFAAGEEAGGAEEAAEL